MNNGNPVWHFVGQDILQALTSGERMMKEIVGAIKVVLIAMCLLLCWVILKGLSPVLKEIANTPPGSSSAYPTKLDVWVMAQQFVEKKLKSPSTASYGHILRGEHQDPDSVVTALGGGKYRVRGWVDSQNSFGAEIRTNFTCELEHRGGKSWRASVEFGDPPSAASRDYPEPRAHSITRTTSVDEEKVRATPGVEVNGRSKSVAEAEPEEVKALRYQVLKTSRYASGEARVYALLKPAEPVLPTEVELEGIAEEKWMLKQLRGSTDYDIYFYLPGMDRYGNPWAIANKSSGMPLTISTDDLRVPDEFLSPEAESDE